MKQTQDQKMNVAIGKGGGQRDMLGIRLSVVAHTGKGDDDIALVRLYIGPGQSIPLHTHEEECIYVLDGQLQVFIAGAEARWHAIEVGENILVPADLQHAVKNTSHKPADVLAMVTGRLAKFFDEVSTPASAVQPRPPTSFDLERFVSKAADYNYFLSSPDESAAITG